MVELGAITGAILRRHDGQRWVRDPQFFGMIPWLAGRDEHFTNVFDKVERYVAHGDSEAPVHLLALVEDGSYHERLRRDVREFVADPHVEARPIPQGLVPDPLLMLAMDQFKDVRGYTAYASRLDVGWGEVVRTFVHLAFNETVGGALGVTIGRKTLVVEACDAAFRERHLPG